jgi:hypothetical protein
MEALVEALEECHRQLAKLLGSGAEPVEVLRCAEEHRAYWRPEHIRVLLLAESHVYTPSSELNRRVGVPGPMGAEVPEGFVRLVYCLGYGENGLLNRPIATPRNSGTPQFWKIFYSCVNRVCTTADFTPILSHTPFLERIGNKLALLRRMKEAGIWLVDTSLAGLYPKPSPRLVKACLRTSWDAYVGQVIRTAGPSRIVCIGKGVASSLGARLFDLGIPVTVVPQPNAHLGSTQHVELFQQYYDIVWQTLQQQAPAGAEPTAHSPRLPASSETRPSNNPWRKERLSQTRHLCEIVPTVPKGVNVRSWTLREDNHAHFHGVVRVTESPLYLALSWRPNAIGRVRQVGLFKLDLCGLLQGGYIRHDPVDSAGPELRLRTVRAVDGLFYIQARHNGPRIQLPTSGENMDA